jgi:hypothetical protein
LQVHFYAVVGWSLPIEISDQLMHVIKANPKGCTWKHMAERKEFSHAEKLSTDVREHLLSKFLKAVKLDPKVRGGFARPGR